MVRISTHKLLEEKLFLSMIQYRRDYTVIFGMLLSVMIMDVRVVQYLGYLYLKCLLKINLFLNVKAKEFYEIYRDNVRVGTTVAPKEIEMKNKSLK